MADGLIEQQQLGTAEQSSPAQGAVVGRPTAKAALAEHGLVHATLSAKLTEVGIVDVNVTLRACAVLRAAYE